MFQNISWLVSLIFLDYILKVVSFKPADTAPYCFSRVPHFVFVFPQHDVVTFKLKYDFFHIQRYDVTLLNIM